LCHADLVGFGAVAYPSCIPASGTVRPLSRPHATARCDAPIGRKSHPMEPMEWQAAQLNNPAGQTWQEFLKACHERLASH